MKDANVVQAFGANWKSELQTYVSQTLTAKSTAAEKAETQAKLDKYLARLNLTRYTSAELAQYLESGAANVDAVAEADQIAQAKAFISANGSGAFDSHVAAEAKNANWSDAQVKVRGTLPLGGGVCFSLGNVTRTSTHTGFRPEGEGSVSTQNQQWAGGVGGAGGMWVEGHRRASCLARCRFFTSVLRAVTTGDWGISAVIRRGRVLGCVPWLYLFCFCLERRHFLGAGILYLV